MKETYLKYLEQNIEGNTCYPNILFITDNTNDNAIAALDLKDISDILISIRKLILQNSNITSLAFSIDREATNRQKINWKLECNNFITFYDWNINSGWKFYILEYKTDGKEFLINNNNTYWNNEMKQDLDILEISKLLK